ncbi:TonB-dependent receptor [Ancylomarina salipaludis]|uniref:TonB-dependent receptor n=1 Tax=Ancylomarina salipaludis TaxID=2501299 RepID=A0A4Q1JJX6_9BACT|nr:carboxypeptidase-like regulatory domain-containing protein [Ancylomarina salipaludis]RXQ89525.1 TonB-dependent receptor [Ancylomarina salipaludis]
MIATHSYAQDVLLKQQLNLPKQEYIVSELFNEINKQTRIEFSYTSDLNFDEKVVLQKQQYSVENCLKQVLDLSSFKIVCLDNKILIVKIPFEEQMFRISGFISDAETGENLINASIYNPKTFEGTVSNNFGFFSFYQKKKCPQVRISYVGYEDKELKFSCIKDTSINIKLQPNNLLREIKVVADDKTNNINHLFLSTYNITETDLKQKSVLGMNDLFRNISYLPGVQTANEASSGLIIRNGSPDQNLILLDDVPVYYQSHLLGLFSIFNPDAIHQARLIKGGFPAQYGGRVSSVLDIRMKDGNQKKIEGEFNLGLLTSQLSVRGPIIKGKTTFNVSARRSYLDLFTNLLFSLADSEGLYMSYYFADLNFKLTHKFSNRDKVYLSTYMGKDLAKQRHTEDLTDNLTEKSRNTIGWGNFTNSIRWNHVYNDKLFGNTSFILSRYTYSVKDQRLNKIADGDFEENYYREFYSGIRDYTLKSEFDFIPHPKYYFKFGFEGAFHLTKPGSSFYSSKNSLEENTVKDKSISALELSLYAENQIQWTKKLLTNIGLRTSRFALKNKTYLSVEPRLTAQYKLNEHFSFNSGFSVMSQYMHLITSSDLSLPTDIWLPVNDKIRPIRSSQYNLGSVWKILPGLSFESEIYYKKTRNILEFSENYYTSDGSSAWDQQVEPGKSWSTGIEFMLKKNTGKTKGHLVYTLAKSEVKYKYLNSGKAFASPYDRRHDLSFQISQKLSSKIDFTVNWTYGSGLPVTLDTQFASSVSPYQPDRIEDVPLFIKRNDIRMPSYHRLDISLNFRKKKKHGTRIWNIGVYNVYNRKNPSLLYMSQTYDAYGNSSYSLKQLSIFGLIPSVSYTYRF